MIGLILIGVFFVLPYVAMNVRRLQQGRRWAFTFCQAAMEWDQGQHAKRVAARAAAQTDSTSPR